MRIAQGVELVRFEPLPHGDLRVQLAIRGQLAPMIDDHISNMKSFESDSAYFIQMARNSELLLHLYGDARNPHSQDTTLRRQEEGF